MRSHYLQRRFMRTLVGIALISAWIACTPDSDFRTVHVPSDHDWPPPGWTLQNPTSTVAISGARFLDEHTGWLIGTNGVILTTTDGGKRWSPQRSGTDRNLYSVSFIDAQRGWIVGEGGTILGTSDGGRTWTPRDQIIGLARATGRLPADLPVTVVHFVSPTTGYVSTGVSEMKYDNGNTRYTGVLLITTDGGETWKPKNMDGDHLYRVATLINGFTVILTVTDISDVDTGEPVQPSWTIISPLPDDYAFAGTVFLDQQVGWAIGNQGVNLGAVFKTEDGGHTWDIQWKSPRSLTGLSFVSPLRGWVAGEYGAVYRTDDGGVSWTQQDSGGLMHLRGITCAGERSCWMLGSYGLVLHTGDAGEHWLSQLGSTHQHLHGVAAVGAKHAWTVGEKGTIVATTDGGATWLRQMSGVQQDLAAVTFVSAQQGWVVGEKGTILATTDGGATWVKQESRVGEAFRGISFISPMQGWIAGTNGTILTTRDGGKNWVLLNRGGGSGRFAEWHFFSISFLDPLRGWAVGQNGTILRSRDGGRSWDEQWGYGKRSNVGFLSDASFPTQDHGWAVGWQMLGGQSVIMATDNGGESWDFQSGASVRSGHSGILRGVKFIDKKVGWTVGGQGTILKTKNGGRTWIKRVPKGEFHGHAYSFHYSPELNAVAFIDAKTGWVVGEHGTILHTTTGGE